MKYLTPAIQPNNSWQWRIDLTKYDRRPHLRLAERRALAVLNARFDRGLKPWPTDLQGALLPLLQPIYDMLRVTSACKAACNSAVHLLVQEMHRRQITFWAWGEAEWLEVLCANERDFKVRHKWSGNCRQYIMAISYLLDGFTDIYATGTCFQYRLAVKVFGREAVDQADKRVREDLRSIGYGSRTESFVPNALYEALLLNRSPRLEDLTVEVLEAVRQHSTPYIKRGIGTLSHVLQRLGIISRTLSRTIKPEQDVNRYRATEDVPPQWLGWCLRWRDTSTLAPTSRTSVFYSLLKVGRWLAQHHPNLLSPGLWTRELAVEYTAAVDRMKVGEWSNPGKMMADRRGKPLRPSAKDRHLGAMRAFFRDCQEWGWIKRHFDPYRVFATPRSVRAALGPDPRVIADDVWAKLLWAGLNLEARDLPANYFLSGTKKRLPPYPFEMVRAVSLVWLFAGLRRDEISRLRVGCVRWQSDDPTTHGLNEAPSKSAVCLLEVPTNKTSKAFTKPVDHVVGKAIAAWERIRLEQPLMLDAKTGEMVSFLFMHRGKGLGKTYLNQSLIPMLCRKAGVPEADTRGKITSHRARSTIASQLYNAKEPLSLFELQQWLGHASPESTQYYAKITPTKLAQSYRDAGYFERNIRAVEVLLDQEAVKSAAILGERKKLKKRAATRHSFCA